MEKSISRFIFLSTYRRRNLARGLLNLQTFQHRIFIAPDCPTLQSQLISQESWIETYPSVVFPECILLETDKSWVQRELFFPSPISIGESSSIISLFGSMFSKSPALKLILPSYSYPNWPPLALRNPYSEIILIYSYVPLHVHFLAFFLTPLIVAPPPSLVTKDLKPPRPTWEPPWSTYPIRLFNSFFACTILAEQNLFEWLSRPQRKQNTDNVSYIIPIIFHTPIVVGTLKSASSSSLAYFIHLASL